MNGWGGVCKSQNTYHSDLCFLSIIIAGIFHAIASEEQQSIYSVCVDISILPNISGKIYFIFPSNYGKQTLFHEFNSRPDDRDGKEIIL